LSLTTPQRLGECGSPPYSRDFALIDCHFFEIFTKHLAGKRFAADDDIKQAPTSWLQTFAIYFFDGGMKALIPWQNRRLNISDDYMED
jgi:hypothetical protein